MPTFATSSFIDALPGLVWTLHADGGAAFVNRRWCDYTGMRAEELSGQGWRAAVHPHDLSDFVRAWNRIQSSGKSGEVELRLRRHDGEHRWFSLRFAPMIDDPPGAPHWCGIASCADERGSDAPDHRLQRFVDGLPTQVIFLKPTGELEFVNRATREYYGKTLDELKDYEGSNAVHPDDQPEVRQRLVQTLTEGVEYDAHHRMRRHDGVYRWVRARMLPSRDAEGNIVRYCSIQTDVHDLKRAEALLTGEVRVLEMVARGRPLTEVLEALCRLVEQLADGTLCSILLIEPNGARSRVGADPSLPAQHGLSSCWSMPILSHREAVLGIFSIYRREEVDPTASERELVDRITKIAGITIERTQADTALRASEAELRHAHAHLTEAQRLSRTGSFTWDVQADRHLWSEEIYRIFGFEPGIPVQMSKLLSAIHPEDLSGAETLLGAAVQGNQNFDLVFRIIRPDGAVKYVHVVGHRSEHILDRPVFLGALRDITDSKIAEEALHKARADLAHVTRVMTLGALTASIAHEVNQPLSGIITNASTCLLMLNADPPNLVGARATAQRTLRDGNRAAEVIQHLRALFARTQPANAPVDLNDATREVLALSSSELHRSRVVLRTDFDANLPTVPGDRVQLQQVILNLIVNAADAMREIDDRPRHLLVATSRDDRNGARLSVSDTGVGIDPQNIEQLFNAFYTTKRHGMGVGLSISRTIIESHAGRLWAAANEDHGATFCFSLPGS